MCEILRFHSVNMKLTSHAVEGKIAPKPKYGYKTFHCWEKVNLRYCCVGSLTEWQTQVKKTGPLDHRRLCPPVTARSKERVSN